MPSSMNAAKDVDESDRSILPWKPRCDCSVMEFHEKSMNCSSASIWENLGRRFSSRAGPETGNPIERFGACWTCLSDKVLVGWLKSGICSLWLRSRWSRSGRNCAYRSAVRSTEIVRSPEHDKDMLWSLSRICRESNIFHESKPSLISSREIESSREELIQ